MAAGGCAPVRRVLWPEGNRAPRVGCPGLHLYLEAVIGEIDPEGVIPGVDLQISPGSLQKLIQGRIVMGVFAVKETEALDPCSDGKLDPQDVAGIPPVRLCIDMDRIGTPRRDDAKVAGSYIFSSCVSVSAA